MSAANKRNSALNEKFWFDVNMRNNFTKGKLNIVEGLLNPQSYTKSSIDHIINGDVCCYAIGKPYNQKLVIIITILFI